MIRSLRLRLVLISTLVSGVALVGVSLLAWHFIGKAVEESVDVRLEAIAGRILRDLHPRADMEFFRERIQITHEDEMAEGLLLLQVQDDVNRTQIFSSLSDGEALRSRFPEGFPEGFPEVPDAPASRPEWSIPPAPEKEGRKKGGPPDPPEGEFRPLPPPEEPQPRGSGPPLTNREWRELESELLGDEPRDPGRPPVPRGPKRDPAETRVGMSSQYADVLFEGKEWRIIIADSRGYSVLAGLDLTRSTAELDRFRNGFFVGIPLALLLIGFGGWLVADRALRPIRRIAETASQVTAHSLSERIEGADHSDPEIGHLTEVLNAMMDRLERGFSHANRFSADVSHELKTPITVMQGEIEDALRACEPGTAEEARLLVLREETGRLKSITRSLMQLSQADVGELIQRTDAIDLSGETTSLVEDAEIVAESSGIEIRSGIEPGIRVKGDAVLLRQALLNLLNNAIKYNVEGGEVIVNLRTEDHLARFTIENTSEEMSSEDREKVFDRFYRADRSRSRGVDGFGLGLSLARAIVEGHRGWIELQDCAEGRTRFEVSLPIADSV